MVLFLYYDKWKVSLYEVANLYYFSHIYFTSFGYDDLFPHYGGERKEDVQKRLKETLTDVMDKEDHQTVLALSHAGACMCFLSTVIDPEEILKRII